MTGASATTILTLFLLKYLFLVRSLATKEME